MTWLRFLLSTLAAIITTTDCYCYSTLYANTYFNTKSVSTSAQDLCTINISPSWLFVSSYYYLEISWSSSHFNVQGYMPFCKDDYVEVFLTSSYRSIGKFCSNNAGSPFTMFSRDGYAKIVYSTGRHTTGISFTFYYRLRYKSSYPLGGSTYSSVCYNTNNYGGSGVIYSTGWPSRYIRSYFSCNHKIQRANGYQGVLVVFMDINMYNSYYYGSDCVQLFGSNTSSYQYEKAISPRLCNTNYMKRYTTYSSYLQITFERQHISSYSYRGFVAGYIMFRADPTSGSTSTTSPTPTTRKNTVNEPGSASSNAAIIVPSVLLPIAIVIIIYAKRRLRSRSSTVTQSQAQSPVTASTTQQSLTHQAPQVTVSMSSRNARNSQPDRSYGDAAPPSFSDGRFVTSGNAPQRLSFMVVPKNGSIQRGTLTPSPSPGSLGQQSSRVLYSVHSSCHGHAGHAPLAMPAVDVVPSSPPPAYHKTINS